MEEEKIGEVILVPRKVIRPFPNQPRTYFDERQLYQLASSIKKHGQWTPAPVRKISDGQYKYELIDGQRRWFATEIAGLTMMKVIVADNSSVATEDDQFKASVISNFGRANHTPVEIALAIKRFKDKGMTEQDIADIFACSVGWVQQHYKILKLLPEVLDMMSPERHKTKRLKFSMALMIADLPQKLQKNAAEIIIRRQLKTGSAREFIRGVGASVGVKVGDPGRTPREDHRNVISFIRRFEKEADIFCQKPQDFFDKMFQSRSQEDAMHIVIGIQRIKEKLDLIESKTRNTLENKKPKVRVGC